MAGFLSYDKQDYSRIVYFLIILISIFSIWFLYETDIFNLLSKGVVNYSSEVMPQIVIALYRTMCAYIAFHAIFFWMIMDKNGATMYAFYKHEKEVLYTHIKGLERLVTFSSWNLMILCSSFILGSLCTWGEIFQISLPVSFKMINSLLYCTSLGMAIFTSTIVTYILAPNAIKSGREYGYLFEKHQQMMHNWPVIFLFLDLIMTKPNLLWEFLIFGVIIAIIYVVFAYIFSNYFGGYYVYQFIDPRLKYSPLIMSLLAIAISIFYILVWIGLKIVEWNYFLGILIFGLWCYAVILFKPDSIEKK